MTCGYVFAHDDLHWATCPRHNWLSEPATNITVAFARLRNHHQGENE